MPLGQLLRTKLVLPPPRPGALPRTALVDRLRAAPAPRCTVLVVAGAGRGRSMLVEARQVLRGCPDPGHLCADPRTAAPEPAATPATGSAVLSPRQAEILRLLADDLTSTEIADRLALSLRTVEAHLRVLYPKLGVRSRSAATRYVVEHGVVATATHPGKRSLGGIT